MHQLIAKVTKYERSSLFSSFFRSKEWGWLHFGGVFNQSRGGCRVDNDNPKNCCPLSSDSKPRSCVIERNCRVDNDVPKNCCHASTSKTHPVNLQILTTTPVIGRMVAEMDGSYNRRASCDFSYEYDHTIWPFESIKYPRVSENVWVGKERTWRI